MDVPLGGPTSLPLPAIMCEDLAVDEDAPGSSGLLIVSTTALGFLWSSGPSSSSADLRLVCAGARGAA
eukprot:3105917-Heterocapsa_arctica.AAC.1